MAAKLHNRHEVEPRGFYDTMMSYEMPEVWAAAYVLALVFLCIFFLTA